MDTILAIETIVQTPGVLGGRPRIAGRRVGVDQVALMADRLGMSVPEIAASLDLSPAEIHAALAYYYDHPDQIDSYITALEQAVPAESGSAVRREVAARWQAASGFDPDQEISASEAARDYGISPQAVREACSMGLVSARKSGSTWLIKRLSAHQRWSR
jgi:uncharacterized protein (DUF433 family)